MKLGKIHLNIGTEDKPKGLCGTQAKYPGYASRELFENDLGFNDKCMFCVYKASGTEDYYNHSITGALKNKTVKEI